ncbi:type I phosphomannose isomerase catalytic subunit [Alicyclobacillus kakegawensis]|uniref:type I phosphomannose isomerase catalytic subunit n=1 Tax=Alicyclobacillus kakegawensis TaxID=392012 RepID=UPI001FE04A57|nr:type I phosphomannose isomerase catalytic subunit [Alicyclobacillus kakegawensis]
MAMFYPVKFTPIAMERIWGGGVLKSWFGVATEAPIGEYWVLSGHPNGTSVVSNGWLAGKSLVDLTAQYPEEYLGDSPQPRFPLLVKFLEASTDLSVQIHPDDAYAKEHEGDFGKTEAWYVLKCPERGRVNYGHRFQNREQYRTAILEGRVKDFLEYRPIQPGDVVYVPSRTLHALLGGTMVIEVQQTSDVTYRVYDWDRVGKDGRPRELHVERAADAMIYRDDADELLAQKRHVEDATQRRILGQGNGWTMQRLVTCPYFTLDKVQLEQASAALQSGRPGNPDILICADGSGVLRWQKEELPLKAGDTLLVPASIDAYELASDGRLTALRTYY